MSTQPSKTSRLALIDIARGVALVAMTIYHFTWDLEFFGWALPGTVREFGWLYFARGIATSFLFLVGVSLYLGHRKSLNWPGFWKRWFKVTGAAAIISIATWFAIPDAFIFFGILHAIALFSILALVFLKFPWWLTLLAATLVFFIAEPLRHTVFDAPVFWWTGLSENQPRSNDYVPLFPWFSATLFGLAAAQLTDRVGIFDWMSGKAEGGLPDRSLGFIGRHSLLYYLVHQPVLLAGLWAFTAIAGPPDRTPAFLSGCQISCEKSSNETFCRRFCECTADGLKQQKLFTPFHEGQIDLATHDGAQSVIRQCSIE